MADILIDLFERYTSTIPVSFNELPSSGSNRRYFRLEGGGISLIGVKGTCKEENHAFIELSRHFTEKGIKVPKVLITAEDGMAYLQEDLGSSDLYSLVSSGRENGVYSSSEREILCRAIEQLPKIQFEGADGLDFSVCYPEPAFNERMVSFDLNYFKYCFLKPTGLEFSEIRLENDFDALKADLMKDSHSGFMYRDFQARNVMIKDNEPYFIDFQGGRRGPIYYDVASFVWQARSRFPEDLKLQLVKSYLRVLKSYINIDESEFYDKLRLFVLFRTIQVLGAYGFRGYFEKKPHFLASVPYALGNLRKLLANPFPDYPYLSEILIKLTEMPELNTITSDAPLEVTVYSFAFKKGIPSDTSGNGGGYVFDCRSINNPGKYEHYRQFTGLDKEVISFLEDDGEILVFLDHVYSIVDAHVRRFIERKFTHLQVCFGCTGGQHRSVYSAEHLAKHLASKFDIKVRVVHRELSKSYVL